MREDFETEKGMGGGGGGMGILSLSATGVEVIEGGLQSFSGNEKELQSTSHYGVHHRLYHTNSYMYVHCTMYARLG